MLKKEEVILYLDGLTAYMYERDRDTIYNWLYRLKIETLWKNNKRIFS